MVNWEFRNIAECVLLAPHGSHAFEPSGVAARHLKAASYLRYTLMLVSNREMHRTFGAGVDVLGKAHRFATRAVL